jgi:nucleoside-diphosphate-sugar epimerase
MTTVPNQAAVLGGNGFIGRALTCRLVAAGREVRVISRSAGHGPARPGVVEHTGDVSRPETLDPALSGCDTVFQLTTGGGNAWADFERDIVQGSRNVAAACLRCGVRRFVYVSSIAALYLGRSTTADESLGPDPRSACRNHYARAKAEAERLLASMHRESGLPVVVCRPAVVVGPGGMLNHGGLGFWPSDVDCLGWGRGRNPLPFVLANDVADALERAGRVAGIEGLTFNLAGDVLLPAREFVEELARRSLRAYRFHSQSLWKMHAIDIGKWFLKVLARKPDNAFPSYRDLKTRTLRTQLDCRLAKERLGWQPNSDREYLLREAIDANLTPIPAGDLRLSES